MRKGTSALGTDVPSEREINRLAARTDEEFWLFEKMDEERRQKENYRSRLMEEHEVPDWVYITPSDIIAAKSKGSLHDDTPITGKRIRKEVIREDTISDSQWMKAVENGDDGSKHSSKRRRENPPVLNNELPKGNIVNNVGAEKKVLEMKSETGSMASEEDTLVWSSQKFKNEGESSQGNVFGNLESGFTGLTWKAHKRKRSSLV